MGLGLFDQDALPCYAGGSPIVSQSSTPTGRVTADDAVTIDRLPIGSKQEC